MPIIMLTIGALGVACLAWVAFRQPARKAEAAIKPMRHIYVAPSNDEDVDRMVAAMQQTRQDKR